MDYEILKEYSEGIIALSACLAGEVQRLVGRGQYEKGREAALRYQEIFGKGNFFLELQDHGIPAQNTVNQNLLRMSQETGIDLVATNDIHYTYAEDATPHDILLCIQTGKKRWRMRTACATRGANITANPKRRCVRSSPMQEKPLTTLTRLQSAVT